MSLAKGMIGLAVIGDCLGLDKTAANALVGVMMGKYDEHLLAASQIVNPGIDPHTFLTNTKSTMKARIQLLFELAIEQDQLDMKQKLEDLKQKLKDSQKPHTAGTVAEIAIQYGISKSEVRRLKQEGKLDEFLAAKQNT